MARATYEFKDIRIPDAALLAEWYRLYKAAFPHPDEQEPIEFFRQNLVMNGDRELQSRFGPYREFVVAMRDTATGEVVAGLNFGVTTSEAHRAAGVAASVHVVFLFIAPEHRDRISGRRKFQDAIREHALAAVAEWGQPAGEICTFFEVNNPLDMSPDELTSDYANSGTDTFHRYMSWLSVGWPLDFRYVQPALSADKGPVEFLHLFYDGPGVHDAIASDMLWHHLYSFISLSVLKGGDAGLDPDFRRMDSVLKQTRTIGFLRKDDRDIARIANEDEARSSLRRARRARGTCGEKPVEFPVTADAFARAGLFSRMGSEFAGLFYGASRRFFGMFERSHARMAMIEFIALIVALGAGALALRFDLKLFYELSIESASLRNEFIVTAIVSAIEVMLFIVYGVYIASRFFVSRRRSHLGPSLQAVASNMKALTSRDQGDDAAQDWLSAALVERTKYLDACGFLVGDTVDVELRDPRLRKLAQYASGFYSERIWDGVDEQFADREYGRLKSSLEAFPQGAWGASFANCPDRVFASLILPVVLPTAQAVLDLDAPLIDAVRARELSGRRADGAPVSEIPCLLVLRQLPSAPLKGARPSRRLDQQLDLLLTTLLHLADMLEKLSHGGDIQEGLERVSILSIASNADARLLLEGFGFKLLQSPAGANALPQSGHDDRSHFSLYALAVEKAGRGAEAQRFLQLLSQLQRARYARAG
ncbi:MAG: hypothetical protein ACREHE_06440 [Rhizomicrobium sp.]